MVGLFVFGIGRVLLFCFVALQQQHPKKNRKSKYKDTHTRAGMYYAEESINRRGWYLPTHGVEISTPHRPVSDEGQGAFKSILSPQLRREMYSAPTVNTHSRLDREATWTATLRSSNAKGWQNVMLPLQLF